METTKEKLLKAWKKTKTGVVNASFFVAEKTKKAVLCQTGKLRRFVKVQFCTQILLEIADCAVQLFEHIHLFHLPGL